MSYGPKPCLRLEINMGSWKALPKLVRVVEWGLEDSFAKREDLLEAIQH